MNTHKSSNCVWSKVFAADIPLDFTPKRCKISENEEKCVSSDWLSTFSIGLNLESCEGPKTCTENNSDDLSSQKSNSPKLQAFIQLNDKITDGFSSLNFISKRLNMIGNGEEAYQNASMNDKIFKTKTIQETLISTDEPIDIDELITTINLNSSLCHSEDLFGFEDEASSINICIDSIAKIRRKIFNEVQTRTMNTLEMEFDLEDELDREFMTVLSRAKLPHIDHLTIKNFSEYDEDLETFLSNSLTSINRFEFLCGSFWEDVHDYLCNILQLKSITCLKLKGFIIDLEDSQELFGSKIIEKLMVESCNIAIDDDFTLKGSWSTSSNECSTIKELHFIDDETTINQFNMLLWAVKSSSQNYSLWKIKLSECILSAEQVRELVNTHKLNVSVS